MHRLLLLLIALSLPLSVTAQVYKWVDENGVTHFGSQPPATETQEVKIRESSPGAMGSDRKYNEYNSDILRQSRELKSRKRRQKYEAKKKQYEREAAQIEKVQSDQPSYSCTSAKSSVKYWEDIWDNQRRQGYSISDQNYYEREIEEAELYRDSVCP